MPGWTIMAVTLDGQFCGHDRYSVAAADRFAPRMAARLEGDRKACIMARGEEECRIGPVCLYAREIPRMSGWSDSLDSAFRQTVASEKVFSGMIGVTRMENGAMTELEAMLRRIGNEQEAYGGGPFAFQCADAESGLVEQLLACGFLRQQPAFRGDPVVRLLDGDTIFQALSFTEGGRTEWNRLKSTT